MEIFNFFIMFYGGYIDFWLVLFFGILGNEVFDWGG